MSDCSSWKNFAARSNRSATRACYHRRERLMWAAIRLIRATRVFGVIFLSYIWQVAWSRLWKTRFDTKAQWKKIHRRNARRMYKGFVRLRGVYIKLGQILSIMGTFLPREIVEELEALQDDVPPQSYRAIKKTFYRSVRQDAGSKRSRRSRASRSRRHRSARSTRRATKRATSSPSRSSIRASRRSSRSICACSAGRSASTRTSSRCSRSSASTSSSATCSSARPIS